ncbi:MAG: sigma 54-interacting transcriptional regulator, partial [Candidatus Latescibacterota bacterium]
MRFECGAVPLTLLESELFGHEKGAFTGATRRQLGHVELAEGGTLFPDEVGDVPLEAQGRLLRLLDDRTLQRVGGRQTLRADVRLMAATNADLETRVQEGRFRQDLYYRLTEFRVELPPLRARPEDVPALAEHFLQAIAPRLHRPFTGFAPHALESLRQYEWPGNIRELEHVVATAAIFADGPVIQAVNLPLGGSTPVPARWKTLEEQERDYLLRVLEHTGWRISGPEGAAALLAVPESTLRSLEGTCLVR